MAPFASFVIVTWNFIRVMCAKTQLEGCGILSKRDQKHIFEATGNQGGS